jgi:16S rRNA processing protein RimM
MYLIGYIIKPQGIRGEVKIDPVTPDPNRFNRLEKIFLQIQNNKQAFSIEKVRIADRFVYIKFSGINSRDEAELLRNSEVLIEGKDLIQPEKDEYYVHDLIGCQVFSEDKEEIGVLSDVVQMSSNDIYVVRSKDNAEVLIPAIKDVIKSVDIQEKEIIIHILEGLLE